MLASSESLVVEYIRGTQAVINKLAKTPSTESDAVTAFWSKGFGALWGAGSQWNEQAKAVATDAGEVIAKAGKVAKV